MFRADELENFQQQQQLREESQQKRRVQERQDRRTQADSPIRCASVKKCLITAMRRSEGISQVHVISTD